MAEKNETNGLFENTRSFYRDYTEGMTRERIGKEFSADRTRLKELYHEAIGDDIDPLTGEPVGLIVKINRFVDALGKRLNPTRRLFFAFGILGFGLHYFTSGLVSNFLLIGSFLSFLFIMTLELLEKLDAKREIDFARGIQLSLLPDSEIKKNGFEIHSFANTAKEVGGDYVDVIQNEHGLFVIMADVSGKGLSASLYMVRLQAMVHLLLNKGVTSPKQLFLELNNHIKSNTKDKTFVTACAFFFPKNETHFVYARAGHNPPILYTKENDSTQLLRTSGLALGMASSKRLEKNLDEISTSFQKGDALLIYTDGLTEARDIEGNEFGEKRLESIMEIYGSLDAETILRKVRSSLELFIEEQEQLDDITFSVISKL